MSPTRPDSAERPRPEGWAIGLRVWVERAGEAILGPGRLELLQAIDQHHSISTAARRMGMSYRRAWELVQSINQAAGEPLVTAATGGVHGGGAQLTPLGNWAVSVFQEVQTSLRQTAVGLAARLREDGQPATLHVTAAVSLAEVLGQLLTDFAVRTTGVRVRAIYGASDELADHLLAGAPGDVFLTADLRQLERLRAADLLEGDQQVPLAENGLAAIGAVGGKVSVRRPADLGGVRRIALAEPDCPLGCYTRAYLEGLNLFEALRPRAVWVENSGAAVTAVRAGVAELALVYSSDAARAEGCRTLFRVRRPATPIRYHGAVLRRSQDATLAGRLLTFLTSPLSARSWRRCGFLPVQDRD
jgi:molybdenum ABC transporter molybdate-binding protein